MRLVLGYEHRLFIEALAVTLARHGLPAAAIGTSPVEIIAAVARYKPDICLLDARLPNFSGIELLRTISARHPAVKVVMLCASSDPEVISAAIKAGASGFIRKDQRVEEIAHALARTYAGERIIEGDLRRAPSRSFHRPVSISRNDWLLSSLTSREREVLMRMMEGECTKQIARSLEIAQSTARTHARNMLAKLGVHSRLEATAIVANTGPLRPHSS